jgi:hypothetical protein
VGEEFTGTRGVLETSRNRLIHTKGPNSAETIASKRDITIDAFDVFLTRIQSGEALNMAEQSARSTMIGLLGRTAMYAGREASWTGEFGSV